MTWKSSITPYRIPLKSLETLQPDKVINTSLLKSILYSTAGNSYLFSTNLAIIYKSAVFIIFACMLYVSCWVSSLIFILRFQSLAGAEIETKMFWQMLDDSFSIVQITKIFESTIPLRHYTDYKVKYFFLLTKSYFLQFSYIIIHPFTFGSGFVLFIIRSV